MTLGWVGLLSAALLTAGEPVVSINAGNAMTLPAQRHLVRLEPPGSGPVWLLAVQQDGREGYGLSLYRSDDEAQRWRFLAPIQPDAHERSTADLIAVGADVALVYSYEGPTLSGSARHDVYFQWWRWQPAARSWAPEPAVRVFDATSPSSAYYRAELARDSRGRLWVQAFRLESNGAATAVISVSSDGGRSFQQQPSLATVPHRGGGRLLSLGNRLMFLYAMHDGFQPTRYRIRDDSAPLDAWGPAAVAFPEGVYHGAALSVAVTPEGGVHLVYKDEAARLGYRFFDGHAFGPRQVLVSNGDWALQPAVTLVGSELWVFYNPPVNTNAHQLVVRVLRGGAFGSPQVLDGSSTFKGYPAAAERLPDARSGVPCVFGNTPDASTSGYLSRVFGSPGSRQPPPSGEPPPGGTVLFADDFTRTGQSLGADWTQASGLWLTQGRAVSDRDGGDLAIERAATCADCRVEARVVGFGVPETAIFLRASGGAAESRYELVLRGNGRLQLRRWRSGRVAVLGEVGAGVPLDEYATLSLSAAGSGPVTLVAAVNGQAVLVATDSGGDALTGAGAAGLWTTNAGVVFDSFRLQATAR